MVSVERGKAVAVDASGRKEGIWIESRTFTRGNAKVFDVCEERDLKVSIGDKLITYSGQRTKNGAIINGARVTVTGWDSSGEIIGQDGKVISIRNLSHAYAGTSHKSQGDSAETVLFGLDRHSIRWADQKLAYVAGTRGKTKILVFVENKAELTGIQERTGERRAATDILVQDKEHAKKLIKDLRLALDVRKQSEDLAPAYVHYEAHQWVQQQNVRR